jgi:hypothetical protein
LKFRYKEGFAASNVAGHAGDAIPPESGMLANPPFTCSVALDVVELSGAKDVWIVQNAPAASVAGQSFVSAKLARLAPAIAIFEIDTVVVLLFVSVIARTCDALPTGVAGKAMLEGLSSNDPAPVGAVTVIGEFGGNVGSCG